MKKHYIIRLIILCISYVLVDVGGRIIYLLNPDLKTNILYIILWFYMFLFIIAGAEYCIYKLVPPSFKRIKYFFYVHIGAMLLFSFVMIIVISIRGIKVSTF